MKKIEHLLIIILTTLALSFFYNKGLSTADEGYILHAAQRLHNGEFPYRDFNFIYTPGSLYLISATYTILGESILSGRLLVVITAILTSSFTYLITYKLSKNKLVATLSVLLYLAWAPSHINFPFPVIFCLLTGMISLFIFMKILENPKKLYYFLLGLGVALTFFFKQNFGLALILEYSILLIFLKKLRKENIFYFSGLFLGIAAFCLYLLFTNSIYGFISYFRYVFREYFILHKIIAPSLYDSSNPIASILKICVYLSPIILSALVFFYCLHKKKKIQFIAGTFFVGLYYLAGIYPSTDYVHISPLLSLLGLPLAIFTNIKHSKFIILAYMLFFLIIISGFYTALFKGFYRWGEPIVRQKYYLSHPRMKVWYSDEGIVSLVNYIQDNTLSTDYIYFYFYEPMFYFVSNRRNSLKYLDSFLPDEKLQREYITSIKNRNTKLVISSDPLNTSPKSSLTTYIQNNYAPITTISGYTVWKRK